MGEQLDTTDFQIKQHNIFLKQRSVDRIIQSNIFRDIWDTASERKRACAEYYISALEVRKLQLWLSDDFENHSIRELRQIASHNHILNYCQLSKFELITVFLEKGIKDERNRETIKRNGPFPFGGWCSKGSHPGP